MRKSMPHVRTNRAPIRFTQSSPFWNQSSPASYTAGFIANGMWVRWAHKASLWTEASQALTSWEWDEVHFQCLLSKLLNPGNWRTKAGHHTHVREPPFLCERVYLLCFHAFTNRHTSKHLSSALCFRIEARINQQCKSSETVLLSYIRLPWIDGWKKMTLKNSPFPWYFSFQDFKWMAFGGHILQSDKYSGIFRSHKEKGTSSTHRGKIKWPFLDLTLVTILKMDLKLLYLQGAKTTWKENR